ncbi:MAG: glycine--tRNA ligase subunit beta [Chlamydiae bacterium]|nr:glycine--tRNA ligase subunit beta [Chlamydiota bacterium]
MSTFQNIIITLQKFWTDQGCLLQQSSDTETGAGTFNAESLLRCIGPEPYKVCHVEISRRPTDGRYGLNPNRLQQFHQFQVILKPSPSDIQKLYLKSLEAIGLDLKKHDIRFVHDDWESPTLGAWGLGWEVWCDGMEVTQFTYFQCVSGLEAKPVTVELAYGIERLAMFLQKKTNIFDILFNDKLTYGEVFLQNEVEWSHYNFEESTIGVWKTAFEDAEKESKRLCEQGLSIPAYNFALKASHAFNMLDARGAISTTARVDLIHRIKSLACEAAKAYLTKRESLGFPLLKETPQEAKTPSSEILLETQSKKTTNDFLFEIGSEELPAAFVANALETLEKMMRDFLREKGLNFESLKAYGTPRRLAILIKKLDSSTKEEIIEKRGPLISIAFDAQGSLTTQGKGFLDSIKHSEVSLKEIEENEVKDLAIKETKHLVAFITKPKEATSLLLQTFLPYLITHLPFPKSMRWADFDVSYARPIRWIVALFGKHVIPFKVADINSSNISYGHSQLKPKPFKIRRPKSYARKLKWRYVIASHEERRKFIEKQIEKFEKRFNCKALSKDRILDEVLYLSEYPTIASYTFDEKFLTLPSELLSSEMIHHQKYFPLYDGNKKMTNKFLVAIDTNPNETILKNNQSVLRARLSDGLFLYEQDLKKPLDFYQNSLKEIVFHKELGSVYDKSERIKKLSSLIANMLEKESPDRAASLCKADLATSVVYEFPELQGVMGKYYALHQKESERVAVAIEEHWLPLTEGGPIPSTDDGAILSIADKLDNLISYTSIGLKATSSKDPYGLRRSAIGIIRILIENRWSLDLSKLAIAPEILDFIVGRLKGILEERGFAKEEVLATISISQKDPYDIFLRTEALHRFRKSGSAFDSLYGIYKRAKGQIGKESIKNLDRALLQESFEKTLSHELDDVESLLRQTLSQKDYYKSFEALTQLNAPLSHFFDNVRVMSENPALRDNRIALLQKLFSQTNKLVDFSYLQ